MTIIQQSSAFDANCGIEELRDQLPVQELFASYCQVLQIMRFVFVLHMKEPSFRYSHWLSQRPGWQRSSRNRIARGQETPLASHTKPVPAEALDTSCSKLSSLVNQLKASQSMKNPWACNAIHEELNSLWMKNLYRLFEEKRAC